MKISVITPSYNQLEWLKLNLASVRDQVTSEMGDVSLKLEVEHIVQDGGSEGLEEFGRKMTEFRSRNSEAGNYTLQIHREPDTGMYDAINKGFARASGEICAWLNCDEQYLPGTLSFVAGFFKKNPAVDVLFGDALLLEPDGMPVSYRRIMVPGCWHTRLVHLHSLSCSMFFRKRIINWHPVLEPEWKVIGDAVLINRFIASGASMQACGLPLAAYAFTGSNLSQNKNLCGELRKWHAGLGWPPAWWRSLVIVHHRLRRLLAGAYMQRPVNTALYFLHHPEKRTQVVKQLGWAWKSH